jgi:hypothetical protein
MGIFKNLTRTLKKAAPLIGSTIGFAIGGPAGAAIGSGIGSLASGRSVEDALLSAGLAYGVGSFAKGAGFGPQATSSGTSSLPVSRADALVSKGIDSAAPGLTGGTVKIAETVPTSFTSKLLDFAKSPTGIATLGGGLALASLDEEKPTGGIQMQPYPVGKTRLGTGRIGNKLYNLDDPDERRQYFEDNRKRQGAEDIELAAGGEVTGPGTGTSDSVPARLSDGEFVVTAKAVRGAGGGDRDVGAARMYDMMSQLERVA